jgi:AraC-like DNA-binding protein
MRTLADADSQIAANFRARLAEVVNREPADRAAAGLTRLGMDSDSLGSAVAPAGSPQLFEILDVLNQPDISPGIALRFGLARQILDLGLVGYAVLSCRDIGTALDVVFRYHVLTSDAYRVHMFEQVDAVIFKLWIRPTHVHLRRVISEEFTTGFWQVLSELLPMSEDQSRMQLDFDYPAPAYSDLYGQLMPCEVAFDSTGTSVTIPAEWHALSVQTADATVEQVCRAQCDQLLAGFSSGQRITDDVRHVIASVPSNRPMHLEDVADAMLMSTRTLERRLSEAGTCFRQIDGGIRMELAAQYLALDSIPSQEISRLLGYSQPSAFFRAFKARFGVTPRQYAAHQQV